MARKLNKPRIRESKVYTRDPKKNKRISDARKKAAREGRSTKNITAASFGWKSSAADKKRAPVRSKSSKSTKGTRASKSSRKSSSGSSSSRRVPRGGPAISVAIRNDPTPKVTDVVKEVDTKLDQTVDKVADTASAYLRRGIRGMERLTDTVTETVTEVIAKPPAPKPTAPVVVPEPVTTTTEGEPTGFSLLEGNRKYYLAAAFIVAGIGAYGLSKKR